jgi:hypoxanthine phosphoribosyltransferase
MNVRKALITSQQIQKKIAEVAQQIDRDYQGRTLTIVMVMKGAICLVADLIRKLQIPCQIEFVHASSYGHRGTRPGELAVLGLDMLDLSHRDILIVDDIFDTGATLTEIVRQIGEKRPNSLKSLVLLDKKASRSTSYRPDYSLFEIDNHFVVGYGLDYKELYRGLDGIYLFEEKMS